MISKKEDEHVLLVLASAATSLAAFRAKEKNQEIEDLLPFLDKEIILADSLKSCITHIVRGGDGIKLTYIEELLLPYVKKIVDRFGDALVEKEFESMIMEFLVYLAHDLTEELVFRFKFHRDGDDQ